MIGQIVGTYKIVSELGEGGVGTVYKGVDTMLDREVAIKVLRPELVSQDSIVERFRSEAITLAKLNHPNIATLFSLFRQGDELFMILEFVEGETVEDILQRSGKIPFDEAIPFFCQALNGLNYAHKLQIIHRDIKPSNMILTKDNVLKILDFGIARLLGSSRMTKVGNIIGTLEYMSPEQIRGEETDARSDIYGLGIMLYEILTGRLPFESENEFVLMKAHTEETPALPRTLNPDIPIEIEAAIIKAIAKNPDARFQNADEFLQTLLESGFSAGENPAFGVESVFQAKTSASHKKQREKKYESKDFPKDLEVKKEAAEEAVQTENLADIELDETTEFIPNEIEEKESIESPVSITEKDAAIPIPAITEPIISESINKPAVSETDVHTSDAKEIKETRFAGSTENVQRPKAEVKPTRLGAATDNTEVKPTRLGAVTDKTEVKPTRLGAIDSSSAGNNANMGEISPPAFSQTETGPKPFPASMLKKLSWIHYAGAGAILFVLFSIISIAAVSAFMMSSGSSGEESQPAANSQTVKSDEDKKPVSDKPIDQDSQSASDPSMPSIPLGDTNLEDTGEIKQPTPAEVAGDKPQNEKKGTGGKKNTTKKVTGGKNPGTKSTKRGKNTGGKSTKGGKNTGGKSTKGGSGGKTTTGPKPVKTPGMTDN